MATEAFDPFANDDEEDDDVPREGTAAPIAVAAWRSAPRDARRDAAGGLRAADILQEFGTAFSSLALTDGGATDQFGFPSACFPATFEPATAGARGADANTSATPFQSYRPVMGNLEGVTVVMGEEMSVIHKTQTNNLSVKVRGNISLEARSGQHISCDVSLLDPTGHLEGAAAANDDFVQPIASASEFATLNPTRGAAGHASFRISMPDVAGKPERRFRGPLIGYTCGDQLRPVPMLITTNIQEFTDRCQIMFQLRVNPRNTTALSDAVVLVAVPEGFDGAQAWVSSDGRTTGQGDIDTQWSDLTRILSWRLGDLHSGAICEFEAGFPPRPEGDPVGDAAGPADARFPVLLRYDAEGSLLSDVGLDFGDGPRPSSVRRRFRVYHREV